ncbi:helix-turn-helix domain-containing protein [Actinomycetospora sp. TBRC 11914]|uniref:AraC-like ligand-binding domain-containing protein n=1 Tax=Actinomycetospora sp. TBRC 11914 TaxID=2729387 RepID=UPI00145ED5C9|nr:helix-turn-helix domain-containing protein [Actinomycetospora sp. TBRC 11914]NMO90299.1 helix-turn-helix domain-containing protein [Actinomycetospora sp. TBRC 11914]
MDDEVRGMGAWQGAVTGALLRFDVECARPERFRGSVSRRRLGEASLVAMTSRPHRAVRTAAHIDASPAEYLLSVQLAGTAEFRQDGRLARVGPGDLVFYDSTRPVEITSGEDYRSLCFRFPTAGGGRRAADLTATTLDGARGLTPAVAGLLTGLHEALEGPGAGCRPDAVLATARHAAELARTLFDDELARRGLLDALEPHAELRARVERHIDENLADPTLSPRSVAAAMFVSTRLLHAVFAEDGRTVGTTIRERRLQRCLADLTDPAQAATPVSAIARRWGFPNATRFGQLVKSVTGRTPVAYRRAMLRGA